MPIGTLRWGRKFFVTEDREIGIGPAHLQPNDHICVAMTYPRRGSGREEDPKTVNAFGRHPCGQEE
jgi:hypothetical protein